MKLAPPSELQFLASPITRFLGITGKGHVDITDMNDIIVKLKDALSRLVHPAPGIFTAGNCDEISVKMFETTT